MVLKSAKNGDIGELSESDEGELMEPDQENKDAAEWTNLGEELEAVDSELNLSKGGHEEQTELEPDQNLASCWTGPITRSRFKAQREALQHLIKYVRTKPEGEIQDKPAWSRSLSNRELVASKAIPRPSSSSDPGREAYPGPYQVFTMADDDARRDEEAVDEPVVQQIRLDQLQFKAMIAEITRRMQRVNQVNVDLPGNDLAAGVAAGRVRMRARRGARAGGEAAHDDSAEESDDHENKDAAEWTNWGEELEAVDSN
ncbi:hypothetical protein DY000_02030729 [Brassica cretica]|uniref:Rrn9 domain-containing protein n=1 Tax=Brassica cretica TaxID=69181 RepID=A0ABQ7DQS6_BRACR|nr:hypothetical protein DY000_02030729 [Brassica cretica]